MIEHAASRMLWVTNRIVRPVTCHISTSSLRRRVAVISSESRERFVSQQQIRLQRQPRSARNTLLHSSRQPQREVISKLAQSHQLEIASACSRASRVTLR